MLKWSNWFGEREPGMCLLRKDCSTSKNSVALYAEVMRAMDVFGKGDFIAILYVNEGATSALISARMVSAFLASW